MAVSEEHIKNVEVYNGFAFRAAVTLTGTGLTLIISLNTQWGGETATHCIRCQQQAHKTLSHSAMVECCLATEW